LTGGQHSITAVYLGDPNFATSTSPAITQTVNRAATTTADVTASFTTPPATPVFGQPITFTTQVTAAASLGNFTGAVNFYDNSTTLIGSTTVNGSGTQTASITVSNLALGGHSITATYVGDINFLASSSLHSLSQQINPDATTTAVTSTNTNSVYGGESVTATVSPVSPGVLTPTGTVTFTVVTTSVTPNTTRTETDSLVGGVATLSVLPPGTYSITATYNPTTSFYSPSTSSAFAQTVSHDSTSVSASSSNPTTFFGQADTFTATITATTPPGGFVPGTSAPTGTVTFLSGTTPLGAPVALRLVNGSLQASLTVSSLPAGNQTVTTQYSGDPSYSGNSSTVSQTVNPATTLTTLASSSANNTSAFGQPVTFTATITVTQGAGAPQGTVNFYDGPVSPGNLIGSGTVTTVLGQQQASFTTQATQLAIGIHSITAVYTDTADSNFASSTSAVLTQTVTPVTTFSTVQSSRITPVLGHPVTFTATVSTVIPNLGTPNGNVIFNVDGNQTSMALDASGQAALTMSTLALGSHSVTVTYQGTSVFLGNTSRTLSFVVLTPNQGYVAQTYRDLLGREVDGGGLAYWSGLLDQGQISRPQIAANIEASGEYRTDVVDALYVHYLHRHADSGGLGFFVPALGGGMTDEQVAEILIGSPEYFNNRGGGTIAGFLNALFNDALGRGVDPLALQGFGQALNNGASTQQVATAILTSPEYEQDVVTNYYNKFLHRGPDGFGLTSWANALAHGLTDEALIAQLIGSDEYYKNL
jgi:hypothetical protein